MKSTLKALLIIVIAASLLTNTVCAAGRVTFASAAPQVNARFELPADHPLGQQLLSASLSQFRADLFWTSGSSTVGVGAEDLNFSAGFDQVFLSTQIQAGYFAGGIRQLPGWTDGPIVAQVRVWDTSFGDYATSKVSIGSAWAESDLFVITPTLSPNAAPNLVGLGNGVVYTLTYVPEPSALALAGMAGIFTAFRRNKSSGQSRISAAQ